MDEIYTIKLLDELSDIEHNIQEELSILKTDFLLPNEFDFSKLLMNPNAPASIPNANTSVSISNANTSTSSPKEAANTSTPSPTTAAISSTPSLRATAPAFNPIPRAAAISSTPSPTEAANSFTSKLKATAPVFNPGFKPAANPSTPSSRPIANPSTPSSRQNEITQKITKILKICNQYHNFSLQVININNMVNKKFCELHKLSEKQDSKSGHLKKL